MTLQISVSLWPRLEIKKNTLRFRPPRLRQSRSMPLNPLSQNNSQPLASKMHDCIVENTPNQTREKGWFQSGKQRYYRPFHGKFINYQLITEVIRGQAFSEVVSFTGCLMRTRPKRNIILHPIPD